MKILITLLAIGFGAIALSQVHLTQVSQPSTTRSTDSPTKSSFKDKIVIRPVVSSQHPQTEPPIDSATVPAIESPKQSKLQTKTRKSNREILDELDLNRRKSEADYFVEMAKADPNFRETIHLHYRLNGQSGEAFPSLKGIPQLNGTVSYNFKFISAGSNPRAADGSLVSMEVEVTITGNHVLIKRGRNVLFDGTGILIDGIQGSVEDEFIE